MHYPAATWHDPLGRTIATADYGTNGGSALSRPDTVPDRSDTVLVTSMTYNSAGQLSSQTNPGGITTCFQYDAVGRQTEQVLNCVEISSSSSSSSSSGDLEPDDTNVTVLTAYNAVGNVKSITAKNSFTGDQTPQYVYGTTLSNSGIASSLLKRAEIYPDSDDVAGGRGQTLFFVLSDSCRSILSTSIHNRESLLVMEKDRLPRCHAT